MNPTSSHAWRSLELCRPPLAPPAGQSPLLPLLTPLLLAFAVAACSTSIQHDLSEPEANEILVLLQEHGIAGQKSRDGRGDRWVVRVPSGEASRSWQIMQAWGRPRRPVIGFGETFEDPSLIPTPSEDQMRVQRALAGELERSLMAMDAVLDARVHLVIPAEDALGARRDRPILPRASVLLVVRTDSESPSELYSQAAQRLVAGAVDGLAPENVVVVLSPGRRQAPVLGQGLVGLGPFTLAQSSRTPLAIVLVILVGLNLGLGTGLILLVLRQRRRLGERP